MSDLCVTPLRTRENENTLTSCLNLPGIATGPPSPVFDMKPLIELSKCKSVTITNSGNRYGQDDSSPHIDHYYNKHNHSDRFFFLVGCVIALVVLMLLSIISGYWVLNRSKYATKSKSDKKFLKRCVYGAMIVIFMVILFMFYLILKC